MAHGTIKLTMQWQRSLYYLPTQQSIYFSSDAASEAGKPLPRIGML